MDKRRVTIYIAHRPYSFLSTDSEAYLRELEKKANQVLEDTASATHSSIQASAVPTVIALADELLRREKEAQEAPAAKKSAPRRAPKEKKPAGTEDDNSQLSIWDLVQPPKAGKED